MNGLIGSVCSKNKNWKEAAVASGRWGKAFMGSEVSRLSHVQSVRREGSYCLASRTLSKCEADTNKLSIPFVGYNRLITVSSMIRYLHRRINNHTRLLEALSTSTSMSMTRSLASSSSEPPL